MVCCNFTVTLLILLVWILSLYSPYHKVAKYIAMGYLVYFLIRMVLLNTSAQWWAIQETKEQLREKIQPGDVIHTATPDLPNIVDPFNILRMIANESEIHTCYAISHNDQTYILNTHMAFYFDGSRKKAYKNPDSVIILARNNRYVGFLEPLDEFLHVESLTRSYVRVVKTEKKTLLFDPEQKKIFEELLDAKVAHCSLALGKYLETQNLARNQSGYLDLFYYTPDVIRKGLGVISNTLYQLK